MDKNALEQLLSTYNSWMGWSTVGVAVGILGEYVVHFIFEKEARRNRLEMIISILLGAFVLGGVVGEYVFGKKLSQVSDRLQQIADSEVAQANRDAAQARKEAELARQQSAETNERAAKLEKEAAELKIKLAPRRVSSEQARQLCSAIHMTGHPTLDVLASFGGKEIDDFAEDIAKALNRCGFSVTFVADVLIYPVPAPIRIVFAPARQKDAEGMANAMLKAKIATKPVEQKPAPDATAHPDGLRLFVGPKTD